MGSGDKCRKRYCNCGRDGHEVVEERGVKAINSMIFEELTWKD